MVDLTTAEIANIMSRSGRLYFILFLFTLLWFILTAIIMLVMAHKSSKKGQVITIYVVSTLIFLTIMLIGYFKLELLLQWFNVV